MNNLGINVFSFSPSKKHILWLLSKTLKVLPPFFQICIVRDVEGIGDAMMDLPSASPILLVSCPKTSFCKRNSQRSSCRWVLFIGFLSSSPFGDQHSLCLILLRCISFVCCCLEGTRRLVLVLIWHLELGSGVISDLVLCFDYRSLLVGLNLLVWGSSWFSLNFVCVYWEVSCKFRRWGPQITDFLLVGLCVFFHYVGLLDFLYWWVVCFVRSPTVCSVFSCPEIGELKLWLSAG